MKRLAALLIAALSFLDASAQTEENPPARSSAPKGGQPAPSDVTSQSTLWIDDVTGWIFRRVPGTDNWEVLGTKDCKGSPPSGTCLPRSQCVKDGVLYHCGSTGQWGPLGSSGGDSLLSASKCDGVTDDSTVLQAEVNASTGKTVILRDGTCVLGSPLTLVANVALRGFDRTGTTIKAGAGFTGALVKTAAGDQTGIKIEDLALDGDNLADNGILLDSDTNAVVERVSITKTRHQGLYLKGGGQRAKVKDVDVTLALQATGLSTYEGAVEMEWDYSAVRDVTADCNSTSIVEAGKRVGFALWNGDRNHIEHVRVTNCETGWYSNVVTGAGSTFSNSIYFFAAEGIRGHGMVTDLSCNDCTQNVTFWHPQVTCALEGPNGTHDCYRDQKSGANSGSSMLLYGPICERSSFTLNCGYNATAASTGGVIKIMGMGDNVSKLDVVKGVTCQDAPNTVSGILSAGMNHEGRVGFAGGIIVGREYTNENSAGFFFRLNHVCISGSQVGVRCDGDGDCPGGQCGQSDGSFNYNNTGPGAGYFSMTRALEARGGFQGVTSGTCDNEYDIKYLANIPSSVGQCVEICLKDHNGALDWVTLACGTGPNP